MHARIYWNRRRKIQTRRRRLRCRVRANMIERQHGNPQSAAMRAFIQRRIRHGDARHRRFTARTRKIGSLWRHVLRHRAAMRTEFRAGKHHPKTFRADFRLQCRMAIRTFQRILFNCRPAVRTGGLSRCHDDYYIEFIPSEPTACGLAPPRRNLIS